MLRDARALFKYRTLLSYLVVMDIKSRYKGTILGFVWSLLNPLVNLTTLWFIFSRVVKTGIPDYPLFLAIGYVPWLFMSSALSTATPSIIGFSHLIRNIYFPRQIIPLAQVLSNFLHYFLVGNVLLIAFALAYGIRVSIAFFFLPVLILLELAFVFGLSLTASCLQVRFRDTQVLLGHFLTFWFYLTPVFYSIDQVPGGLRWIFLLNPMAWIVDGFRSVILRGAIPGGTVFLAILAFSAASCWMGGMIFKSFDRTLVESI